MKSASIWDEEELKKVAEEKGNENWIRDIYFRWHPIGVIEGVIFLAALLVLLAEIR